MNATKDWSPLKLKRNSIRKKQWMHDKMKKAVRKEDLDDVDRERNVASHHLDEIARLKSDEEG